MLEAFSMREPNYWGISYGIGAVISLGRAADARRITAALSVSPGSI